MTDGKDIKLILADIDGTLVARAGAVSAYTMQTLDMAAERGIIFAPATGRFPRSLPDELKNWPRLRECILMNGSQVWDARTGQDLMTRPLSLEEVYALLDWLEQWPCTRDCFTGRDWGLMDEQFYSELEKWVVDPVSQKIVRNTRKPIRDLRAYLRDSGDPILKVQAFFPDYAVRCQAMERMEREFPNVSVACSLPANVEITRREATKGQAMLWLCTHLGLTPNAVMAFGDEKNDLDMIALAGLGTAMGNARDEIKAVAKLVTDTVDQDGVARAIRRHVLHVPL